MITGPRPLRLPHFGSPVLRRMSSHTDKHLPYELQSFEAKIKAMRERKEADRTITIERHETAMHAARKS